MMRIAQSPGRDYDEPLQNLDISFIREKLVQIRKEDVMPQDLSRENSGRLHNIYRSGNDLVPHEC